jgi:hypothetical protein
MSTSGRQCIFCTHKADSKEHVWSNWILSLLPSTNNGIFVQKLADGTERKWPTSKPELKIGVVCKRNCNNGWMSAKLEAPMKLATSDIIVQNRKKAFTKLECCAIAAWAFKTTILANHMNLHGEPFFSVDQRRAFATSLKIPQGVQVWIARRNAGHLTATYWSQLSTKQAAAPITPHLKTLSISPYRFETYVCVLSVGYLLLQVVAARWADRKIANLVDFPSITQPEVFNSYAIPIWPRSELSVNWPPRHAVGNDIFDTFINRFDRFSVPAWMT